MTPLSILLFSRLYLAGLAIGLLDLAFNWNELMGEPVAGDPLSGTAFLGGVMGIVTAASFALSLLLWHLIVNRASRAAKWILVVFAVVGALSMALVAMVPDPASGSLAFPIIATLLNLAAVAMLFRRDAVGWFRGDQIDPETFA